MKTPILAIICLTFFVNGIIAQVDWRLSVGPQWSQFKASYISPNEKDPLYTGFNVSAEAIFRSNKQLQIYTGLGVNSFGVISVLRIEDLRLADGSPVSNLPEFEDLLEIQSRTGFLYLGIPIGVNYYFDKSNTGLFVDVGFKPSYGLKAFRKSIREYTDGTKEKENSDFDIREITRLNVNGKLGLGYQFSKLKNLTIQVFGESQFRFSKPNQRSRNPFYNSLGISAGIKI